MYDTCRVTAALFDSWLLQEARGASHGPHGGIVQASAALGLTMHHSPYKLSQHMTFICFDVLAFDLHRVHHNMSSLPRAIWRPTIVCELRHVPQGKRRQVKLGQGGEVLCSVGSSRVLLPQGDRQVVQCGVLRKLLPAPSSGSPARISSSYQLSQHARRESRGAGDEHLRSTIWQHAMRAAGAWCLHLVVSDCALCEGQAAATGFGTVAMCSALCSLI